MSSSTSADDTYNEGERMMPIPTYGDAELIRHFSSHKFFRHIVKEDIKKLKLTNLSILDLGFGTGYASFLYSRINEVSKLHAIDVTDDGLEWALENFNDKKINYELVDAATCLSRKRDYDYIITRHVLEHIEDGLNVVKENKYSKRLCVNVPYDEKEGNPYHVLHGIVEKSFPDYKNVEFFYEDLKGITYATKPRGIFINSIVFIASKDGLPPVKSYFKFPVPAATINEIVDDFTDSNASYSRTAIGIISDRYHKAVSDRDKQRTVNEEQKLHLGKVKQQVLLLKEENARLVRELDNLKSSKRWIYSSKIASLKNKKL